MPYSIGPRGSYGCSGYPVVKDGTGEVMGCHESANEAQAQISAINMSEAERGKKKLSSTMGQPEPASYNESHFNWSTPVRKPERSSFSIGKVDAPASSRIKEGDFVMGVTVEGVAFGRVEHIMWEGGTLGSPGEEYSLESMPPENPAMSVRLFEVEGDEIEPTPYSIGMMYEDAEVVDTSSMTMEQEDSLQSMYKADSLFDFGSFSELKSLKQAKTEQWFAMRSEQPEIDLVEKADSVRVGQMVSWNSSGGTARGKVKRIVRNGSYNVPGTEVTVTGTPEDPAAVITLYRDGKATETIVAHKVKTLRAS
jgi:hypothetical protein